MKKIYIVILLLFFIPSLYGAFEDFGRDARARGMGNAFYGEPAGVYSIYYNPAGTAFSRKIELMGTFGLPYAGLETVNFSVFHGAFIFPFTHHFGSKLLFQNTVIGFALNNFGLSYENSKYYDDDDINYFERMITINLSKDFLDMLGKMTRFGIGINANILMRGLDANSDTQANSSYFVNGLDASGFGLDIGFMYFLNYNLILGFVVDNLIEPNVAFNKDVSEEPVDKNYKLGVSWKNDKLWIFSYPTIAVGVSFIDLKSNVWKYRIGYEFWEFNRILGVRLGYELSDEGMNNLSSGLTGKKVFNGGHEIEINYAFVLPLANVKKTYGSHNFSLTYRYQIPAYQFEFDDRIRRNMINKIEENKKLLNQGSMQQDIDSENKWIENNFKNGLVIVKYSVAKKDTLNNIVTDFYGNTENLENLKEYNQIKNEKKLPEVVQIPMDSKSFKLYTVKSGDTLESISKNFYNTPNEINKIKKYNEVELLALANGRVLVIPIFNQFDFPKSLSKKVEIPQKTEAPKKVEEKVVSPAPIPTTPDAAGQEYVVESGDNWSKISKKIYGDPNKYKLIMEFNGITDPNKLQVGQKLKIPPANN